MKKNKIFFVSILWFCCLHPTISNALASEQTSAIGYWTTISDEDNMPRSVVQIFNHQGKLEGRILKVYPKEGDHELCIHCPGKLKKKTIIGLRMMWGLSPDGQNAWSDGQILDPKTGKIYRCKIELNNSGKKLAVRGYIGISFFGRTQTWIRRHKP